MLLWGRKTLQRLHLWTEAKGMRFNKAKGRLLQLRHNSPRRLQAVGTVAGKCPAEKALGVLVDSWVKVSQAVPRWARRAPAAWPGSAMVWAAEAG